MADSVPNTDNSFMKSLYFGQFREDLIFPYPKLEDDTKETVQMIVDMFQKWAADNLKSEEWDREGKMPEALGETRKEQDQRVREVMALYTSRFIAAR